MMDSLPDAMCFGQMRLSSVKRKPNQALQREASETLAYFETARGTILSRPEHLEQEKAL